jgi:hypothetical protein
LGWNGQLIVGTHGVEEKRHAAAAISVFSEGVIDFSGSYYRFGISISHPVDSRVDVVIRDVCAVADNHAAASLPGGQDDLVIPLGIISDKITMDSRLNQSVLLG